MEPYLRFHVASGTRLHLGVPGGVAAYKLLDVLRAWRDLDIKVGVTLTKAGAQFLTPTTLAALGAEPVFTEFFPDAPQGPDRFPHLHPGRFAQGIVVAPATADVLSKAAHGMADDLLACQILACDKPIVYAPAMNRVMWNNPAVQANARTLEDRGAVLLAPESGRMACGDVGDGRLCDPRRIFLAGLKTLVLQDLAGRRVLVTLGATREHLDPVRYMSNPSTGRMGAAVAVAAWLRGAEVHALAGPDVPWMLPDISLHRCPDAQSMLETALRLWPDMDAGVCTAAVGDFRFAESHPEKLKKDGLGGELTLRMVKNPDILASLAKDKLPGRVLIGFAAETGDPEALGAEKLTRKGCDMLLANQVGPADSGFAAATNRVVFLDASGARESWPLLPKTEVAWRLWDRCRERFV